MENRKFKVGDKVRIKVGRFINQTGLVREDDGCNVWVSMDDTKRWLPFMEHELDLVEITLDEQEETPREPISANKKDNYYLLPNGIECKDVVGEFPYNIGTAMAYLWRAGKKPADKGQTQKEKTLEDLNKAIDHIRFEIERIESL